MAKQIIQCACGEWYRHEQEFRAHQASEGARVALSAGQHFLYCYVNSRTGHWVDIRPDVHEAEGR